MTFINDDQPSSKPSPVTAQIIRYDPTNNIVLAGNNVAKRLSSCPRTAVVIPECLSPLLIISRLYKTTMGEIAGNIIAAIPEVQMPRNNKIIIGFIESLTSIEDITVIILSCWSPATNHVSAEMQTSDMTMSF